MHLHELRNGVEAGRLIGTWIGSCNEVRPQSALYGRTPGETATARGDVSGGLLPELTDTVARQQELVNRCSRCGRGPAVCRIHSERAERGTPGTIGNLPWLALPSDRPTKQGPSNDSPKNLPVTEFGDGLLAGTRIEEFEIVQVLGGRPALRECTAAAPPSSAVTSRSSRLATRPTGFPAEGARDLVAWRLPPKRPDTLPLSVRRAAPLRFWSRVLGNLADLVADTSRLVPLTIHSHPAQSHPLPDYCETALRRRAATTQTGDQSASRGGGR